MKRFVLLSLIISSLGMAAGVRLPVHSLRSQAKTRHCWAYAMSHMIESRAWLRDSMDVVLHIEQDAKYWVDYERMMHMFRTKKDFYLSADEGGWQIEYWEAFIRHGKAVYKSEKLTPQVLYTPKTTWKGLLAFLPGVMQKPTEKYPKWEEAKRAMKDFKVEADADAYARKFLDAYYGKPVDKTTFMGEAVDVKDVAKRIFGTEADKQAKAEAVVLVKPASDKENKWVRYLSDRYWGYRFNKDKILALIERSLNNGWPVTFDNVYHAMTIVGFEQLDKETYYAVADSWDNNITWYDSKKMMANLNLTTFFVEAIPGELPPRPTRAEVANDMVNWDKVDNMTRPPGSF